MSIDLTALIIYILFSVGFISYQSAKGKWYEIIPSIMWLGFMSLPFAIQWPFFAGESREIQAGGIIITGLALMGGDSGIIPAGSAVLLPEGAEEKNLADRLMNNYMVYVSIFLIIVLYHLSHIGEVPLLEKYLHNAGPLELKILRENSSKLLDVPTVFKYMFTWATGIVAPLAFLLMLKKKLYIRASLFIFLALLYARITMALLPGLYMLFAVCFFAVREWKPRLDKRIAIPLMIILIVFLVKAGMFLSTSPYSLFRYQPDPAQAVALAGGDQRNTPTLPDNFRLIPEDQVSRIEEKINYVVYRFFLVPAEVSGKWYQFFPEVNGGYIGFTDILPGGRGPGFVHPSNAVGRWAFEQKHPQKYLSSVHAYASVDADAHARMGMTGVLLAGLVILSLRLYIKKILVNSFISRSLYGLIMVQLALLPVQASLPAILIAHGMLLLLLLMTIHYFLAVKAGKSVERIWMYAG